MTTERDYSSSLSSSESSEYLTLLELYHPALSAPVRVVNDTDDYRVAGKTFKALGFRIKLPDDKENQQPSATLSIDNVGRELTDWLETSQGGRGTRCRVLHVLREDYDSPDETYYFDITLRLDNVSVDHQQVTGELGFKLLLTEAATKITHRPDVSPGVF